MDRRKYVLGLILISLFLIIVISCKHQQNGIELDNHKLISDNHLSKPIVFKNDTIRGDFLIPSNHQWVDEYDRIEVRQSIVFENCVFTNDLISTDIDEYRARTRLTFFGDLVFSNCEFKGDVNLRFLQVHGRTQFSNSKFFGVANFEESHFNQEVDFRGSKFWQEVRFQNSFFNAKVNFNSSEFYNIASFQGSKFNWLIDFNEAKFYGYFDFSLTEVMSNSFFNYCLFQDKAIFENSRFFGVHYLIGSSFVEYLPEFAGTSFYSKIVLEKIKSNGPIDTSKSIFIGR